MRLGARACTGLDGQYIWTTKDTKTHKKNPTKKQQHSRPYSFTRKINNAFVTSFPVLKKIQHQGNAPSGERMCQHVVSLQDAACVESVRFVV